MKGLESSILAVAVVCGVSVFAIALKLNASHSSRTSSVPHQQLELIGYARVIDGDTIIVDGKKVRLAGIDAAELDQTCEIEDQTWDCGKEAANQLTSWIGDRPVRCDAKEVDRYDRLLAHCTVDGEDVGKWLVTKGFALAYVRYSKEYEAQQNDARSLKLGIWQSSFIPPWEWRRTKDKP